MRFRLIYSGPLRPRKQINLPDLNRIRKKLHPQLKLLWTLDPLSQIDEGVSKVLYDLEEERAGINFRPIVCKRLALVAHLDVLYLRPQPPGWVIEKGGDIDNRLKTLLDALRLPSIQEIKSGKLDAPEGEDTFYCLLQDDSLITKISFETDRLMSEHDKDAALVILQVTIGKSKAMAFNDILTSF